MDFFHRRFHPAIVRAHALSLRQKVISFIRFLCYNRISMREKPQGKKRQIGKPVPFLRLLVCRERISCTFGRQGSGDHRAIYQMVKNAFSGSRISDGQEQNWIIKQRGTKGYIPRLDLVAKIGRYHWAYSDCHNTNENRELTSLAPALYLALVKRFTDV